MMRFSFFQLSLVATAAFAASTSGCVALFAGVHNAKVSFPIIRDPGAEVFQGWTEITVEQDIASINSATLVSVTLQVETPPDTPDLSFLRTLMGIVASPLGPVPLASLQTIPTGEQAVIMNILFTDDLRPLFKDAHTLRINWTGALNLDYPAWPTLCCDAACSAQCEGFQILANVQLDVH